MQNVARRFQNLCISFLFVCFLILCNVEMTEEVLQENAELEEPLLTQASHIWDVAAQTNGGKDLCIMYHRSDYWEPFVPELDTKDCLRSSGTKEILHVELWHNHMFYYFFISFCLFLIGTRGVRDQLIGHLIPGMVVVFKPDPKNKYAVTVGIVTHI